MKKILITGGAGYIGSILSEELLKRGFKVTVIDKLLYDRMSLANCCNYKNFNFIKSDILEKNTILNEIRKNDIIIPLASVVGAPACKMSPKFAKETNLDSIIYLVQNLSKDQLIFYPTTNSGYGIGGTEECDENSELKPISLYGQWKVEAENIILSHNNSVSFRLATVFGVAPRMRLDLLVNDFCFKAYHYGYIVLFEEHFRRNYIHVRDVSGAFIHAIDNFETMKNNIFNVGLSSANLTKRQLCEKIKVYIPDLYIHSSDIGKDEDKRDYIVSNKKIESTGWNPKHSLDDGINELLKLFKMIRYNNFNNLI